CPGDFLGAIRAAAVHHDDFVGNGLHGLQHPRQIFLLILCDETHAQGIHLCATLSYPRQYLTGGHAGFALYLDWKLTRTVLLPTRNSAPSCNTAARTRSSSKNVPFVESRSFKFTKRSRTSRTQWWREISGSSRARSAPLRPMTVRGLMSLKVFPWEGPEETVRTTSASGGKRKLSSTGGKRSLAVEASARAKEGIGEITTVSSARRLTSTTVVWPQRVQRNCTLSCLATTSSFNMCCCPQCTQPVCIVPIYHGGQAGRMVLARRACGKRYCGVRPGAAAGVLRYRIQDKAGERTCLNTFREKS